MKIIFGSGEGNTRRVFAFGKSLDNGLWFTHPELRGFVFRRGFVRLWFVDLHFGNAT